MTKMKLEKCTKTRMVNWEKRESNAILENRIEIS